MQEVRESTYYYAYLECLLLRSAGNEKCTVYLDHESRKRFKKIIDRSQSMKCSDGYPTVVWLR